MRFGLFHLLSAPDPRDAAGVYRREMAQIALADALGYDAVWIGEHHFSPYGTCGSAIALSAYIAARTSRIRIGQAVNVLPLAHPIRLAEDAAMVDVLSEGRLNFGIGRGYSSLEYGGLGISMDESRERFSESIDIIVRAWTQESFSYAGNHFQIPQASVYPQPVQKPHPPIWMACTSPPTVTWAAQHGYAYLQDHMQPVEGLAQSRRTYAEAATAAAGPDRAAKLLADSAAVRFVHLDPDDARARRDPEPFLLWYQSSLAKYGSSAQGGGAYSKEYSYQKQLAQDIRDRDYGWYLDNVALFGDPARVVEDVHRIRETTGLEHLIVWSSFGGMSDEQAKRNLTLFAERVIPYV